VSVARIIGAPRVVVPSGAGVSSAHGLLVAPVSFDLVRSAPSLLDAADWEWLDGELGAMERDGRAILDRAGVPPEAVSIRRLCDLRFHGQGAELPIELPPGPVGHGSRQALEQAFAERYSALYRHVPSGVPLEVISWRVVASSTPPRVDTARTAGAGDPVKGSRRVWWGGEHGARETTIVDRERLRPGDRFEGPLIVEERESTTVVDPRCTLTVDEWTNLVVDLH
jgi:N-methylhydantoinase A/oxoprolinase/acetone carboxylase beta subunit